MILSVILGEIFFCTQSHEVVSNSRVARFISLRNADNEGIFVWIALQGSRSKASENHEKL